MSIIDIADVRRADDEIAPCFQPRIKLHSLRLADFEARWRDPQLVLVLPNNFVSLVEEHGLVAQLMQLRDLSFQLRFTRRQRAGIPLQVL
jgi:EAL domain-containing protein (putative c-di-GMP-specific phosphodiesterase class I)